LFTKLNIIDAKTGEKCKFPDMTKIQIAMYEKFGQAVLLKGAFQKGDLLKKVEVE